MRPTVHDFLGRSAVAQSTARLDLGAGCAVAVWHNHDDRIRYETPQNHTFSLYLEGGTGTRRLDAGGIAGHPGAICVMPEGCGSEWEITAPFRFVHLYLSDARMRAGFSAIHDCDARLLDLREITFAEDTGLAAGLRTLAAAAATGDVLLAEAAVAGLIGGLARQRPQLRGGLTAAQLHRVDDWIEAHLEEAIHLDDLAALTGLSGYHFHRMFQLSRGSAPHAWVTGRRIARAQALLGGPMPIATVAAACGFSSQSHLTRSFRTHMGRTPAEYRALIRADRGGA
ncbi:AraC family transcriptional regulator [Rhodobacter sp. 140A]|uniref:HTH-type transcriptional activator RhaS n=1 Tax=bioreactor metagenome TaxID=1076179 RepID=A0A644V446_9ZZZZ|nr:AraC family transcriptional regulator [Rhodobacter sp. 140A]